MKYLLSSGETTTNKLTYIKDLISLMILLNPNEIPYSDTGSKDLVPALESRDIREDVTDIAIDVVNKIKSQFKDVKIELTSVTVLDNYVRVSMKLNGELENYDITR